MARFRGVLPIQPRRETVALSGGAAAYGSPRSAGRSARTGRYGYGGAIAGTNFDLIIRDTVMSGNVGGGGGGAISLRSDSALTIERCSIYGNGRVGYDALTSGGGLYLSDSSAFISRSSIHDNVANFGGGNDGGDSALTLPQTMLPAPRRRFAKLRRGGRSNYCCARMPPT